MSSTQKRLHLKDIGSTPIVPDIGWLQLYQKSEVLYQQNSNPLETAIRGGFVRETQSGSDVAADIVILPPDSYTVSGDVLSNKFMPTLLQRKYIVVVADADGTDVLPQGWNNLTKHSTGTPALQSYGYYSDYSVTGSGVRGGFSSASFNATRRSYVPKFSARIRIQEISLGHKVWVGCVAAAPPNLSTLSTTQGFAFVYDPTTALDFIATTSNGTTASTSNMGITVANNTVYLLEAWLNAAADTVYFSVNGGTPITIATTLPATTTQLGFSVNIIAGASGVQTFGFNSFSLNMN